VPGGTGPRGITRAGSPAGPGSARAAKPCFHIAADAASDAWATGSARLQGHASFQPVVEHRDGRAWHEVTPPGPHPGGCGPGGDGGYFMAVFGTSGVSFGAGRRMILEPSQTSGSYFRPTTRSFIGISALSVILMCSGQTSVQHLVMLQ